MWKSKISKYCNMILVSAIVYVLLDLPLRITEFLKFDAYIGLKNFLPSTLGLLFGPWGAAGGCIGCVLSALFCHTPVREIVSECGCVLIMGIGMWLLWQGGSVTHKVHFKRPVHYIKLAGFLAILSGCCGLYSTFLMGKQTFVVTSMSYMALGLLVGTPVNILFSDLLCIQPVLPWGCSIKNDVTGVIDAGTNSMDLLNDTLEAFAFERKISRKKIFEIQNCIEEISIRVFERLPDTQIQIRMDYDDAVSLHFLYKGKKYNPFRIEKDEDEISLMGLKLIKHRVLRAMYRYGNGDNEVHIVI